MTWLLPPAPIRPVLVCRSAYPITLSRTLLSLGPRLSLSRPEEALIRSLGMVCLAHERANSRAGSVNAQCPALGQCSVVGVYLDPGVVSICTVQSKWYSNRKCWCHLSRAWCVLKPFLGVLSLCCSTAFTGGGLARSPCRGETITRSMAPARPALSAALSPERGLPCCLRAVRWTGWSGRCFRAKEVSLQNRTALDRPPRVL